MNHIVNSKAHRKALIRIFYSSSMPNMTAGTQIPLSNTFASCRSDQQSNVHARSSFINRLHVISSTCTLFTMPISLAKHSHEASRNQFVSILIDRRSTRNWLQVCAFRALSNEKSGLIRPPKREQRERTKHARRKG